MEIFAFIFGGATRKIKSLEGDVADGQRKLKSMTSSRDYFKAERDSCLELVKEAGAKEAAYNAAIADYDRVVARCGELEGELATATEAAKAFATEFAIELPDVEEPDVTSPDEGASDQPAPDPAE